MKTFVFSSVLFVLLLAAIFLNYMYVNKTVDSLVYLCEQISDIDAPETQGRINELKALLESSEKYLSLSVSHSSLEKAKDHASAAEAFLKTGDRSGFESQMILLKNSIEDLARLEKIKLG